MWLGFIAALIVFTAIGAAASRKAQESVDDYLLASRDIHPWLAGLSAVATNNSGFMFVGLLGYAYGSGLEVVWFQLSWVVGDVIGWMFVYRRVRQRSGDLSVASLPRLLATRDDGRVDRPILLAGGVLTFVFLSVYAGAQLSAGSLALYSLLDWPMWVGSVLGALIVVIYCVSGGIRASIWTDVAQSFVMLISMLALVGYAWARVGGPEALLSTLHGIDPALSNPWPQELRFGVLPYLLAIAVGGLGAIGQPHILVRTMSLRSTADIPRMRNIYLSWFIPFSTLAVLAGLYSRVLLPELGSGTQLASVGELALPELSRLLLPDLAIGVVLAGLFSATMSTADSQVLACSAAVTQDVVPQYRSSRSASKVATLAVCALALMVALSADESVFRLVLIAWSALGSTLAPILLVRLFGGPMNGAVGIAMMVAGLGTAIAWQNGGLSGDVFEILPGAAAAMLVWAVWRPFAGEDAQAADGVEASEAE